MSKLRQGIKGLLLMGCAGSFLTWALSPAVMRFHEAGHPVLGGPVSIHGLWVDAAGIAVVGALGALGIAVAIGVLVILCRVFVHIGEWYEAKT